MPPLASSGPRSATAALRVSAAWAGVRVVSIAPPFDVHANETVQLAAEVNDARGLIVEGTFTSIPDVFRSFRWGWLPVSPLITQRFESVRKVADIGSPLLVVHGSEDRLIQPELGRKLYEAAQEPKQFVLVEGGSHHNTNAIGQGQYRQAMASLFRLPTR